MYLYSSKRINIYWRNFASLSRGRLGLAHRCRKSLSFQLSIVSCRFHMTPMSTCTAQPTSIVDNSRIVYSRVWLNLQVRSMVIGLGIDGHKNNKMRKNCAGDLKSEILFGQEGTVVFHPWLQNLKMSGSQPRHTPMSNLQPDNTEGRTDLICSEIITVYCRTYLV